MKIITFYADCKLPEKPRQNQTGFDWRGAIKLLEKSAAKQGYETLVVTDEKTEIENPWLRVGDAMQDGLMMWLLKAQAAAIRACADEMAVMVSPDTLIRQPLDFLFGNWHLALLTRLKPKPIVNSVMAFRPTPELAALWDSIITAAETLPPESKEWGADIDAVVQTLRILPRENSRRRIDGVLVKFIPMASHFESLRDASSPVRPGVSIVDFKGARKSLMQTYAERFL